MFTARPHGAPPLRAPTVTDLTGSLQDGVKDFAATPLLGLFFASFFVLAGLIMAWITVATGTTFWLILAVMGYPLVGSLAALGFYEISRRREAGEPLGFQAVIGAVWAHRTGQLPWLAAIIVVIFLFWFFLGHMIFALFLGLSPMTNVLTELDIFLSPNGLMMLGFGTAVGAAFATLVFGMSVLGMPMLLDRDVDFMTAMLISIQQVLHHPVVFLMWGMGIAAMTILAMLPFFLGLFIAIPVFGHASWHFYKRLTSSVGVQAATVS